MNITLALGNSARRVSMEISDSVWFVSSLLQTQLWFFCDKNCEVCSGFPGESTGLMYWKSAGVVLELKE